MVDANITLAGISPTDDYTAHSRHCLCVCRYRWELVIWPHCAAVLNLCLCRTATFKNCKNKKTSGER